MAKAAQIQHTREKKPDTRAPAIGESAIVIAAALEILVLAAGLLWALNSPPGTKLWPRMLLAASVSVLSAICAICICALIIRAASAAPADSSDGAKVSPTSNDFP